MKIDEAIKHAEEVMMENLEKTKDRNASDPIAISCFECADEHRQLAEWLKDYKRLLEQEPCGDCISREAALDDAGLGEFHRYDDYVKMRNYLKSLPSVSAQPKMGDWERDQFTNQPTCSVCGYKLFDEQKNYCPYCGAKMSEIPTGAEGSEK